MGGRLIRLFFLLAISIMTVCILCGCKLNIRPETGLKPQPAAVKTSKAPIREKKKSVIVYRKKFELAAKYFSYLHREYEGVDSLLLSVHAGNSTGSEMEKVASDIRSKIAELDKKYGVMSVLLLGDFSRVPAVRFNTCGNSTQSLVADFGYGYFGGTPENAISVGRIPARTPAQAFAVAAKYDRWYNDRDCRPAWPVVFMGGEGLSDKNLNDSELVFFRLQEEGMAGPEALRYLGGTGSCTSRRLHQSLAWDDAAIQWLMLPAEQGQLKIGNGFVNSTEILSLDYKPGLPLVLEPYCHLSPAFEANESLPTAEAMVLSKGAALGVLTTGPLSSQTFGPDGNVKAELDRGTLLRVNLSRQSLFMLEFHRAYFSGKLRIAEALSEARAQYSAYHSKAEDSGMSILYNSIFLGDPVMSLPLAIRTESPVYRGLKTVSKPRFLNGVAVYAVNSTVTFAMQDNSIYSAVKVRVVDRKSGKTVAENIVGREDLFNFSTDRAGSYIFYSRPVDGPLAWQFFDICENSTAQPKHPKMQAVIKSGLEPVKYSVQVSSNRIMSSAINMRKRLMKKGYPAYVTTSEQQGKKAWYCVRFGEYESFYKAQEASSSYEESEKADAKVVRLKIED